jgi:hypothetical protein
MPPRSASQAANARRREAAIRRTAEKRAQKTVEDIRRNMEQKIAAARNAARNAGRSTLAGQALNRQRAARAAVVQRRRAQGANNIRRRLAQKAINNNIKSLKTIIGEFNNSFASLAAAIARHRARNNPYGMGVSRPVPLNVANRVGRWYLRKEMPHESPNAAARRWNALQKANAKLARFYNLR